MSTIGSPLPRPDGRIKVTGQARYAADHHLPGMAYAVLVTAGIPAGRITSLDSSAASRAHGVVRVLTARDFPRLSIAIGTPPLASAFFPLQNDEVRWEGQPVAVVVADSLEAAEGAVRQVRIRYRRARHRPAEREDSEAPKPSNYLWDKPEIRVGDVDRALASSQTKVSATYLAPSRHHNPMEPSATVAFWEGDRLTVHDAVQDSGSAQAAYASALGIPIESVRVVCPHTGGGFGCKGYVWPHQILTAAVARVMRRPVKLVLTRSQMYSNVGYQPWMRHQMDLASDERGHLQGVRHLVTNLSSVSDDFVEFASVASRALYATPALHLRQTIQKAHVNVPTALRAPVEGPGLWALESAMDELAQRLGMDPLDLRLAADAEKDPLTGKPWSSKKLREAYEAGAKAFGWRERPKGQVRDGNWLVGRGMAACTMACFRFPSTARVRLKRDGTVILESNFHDIGSGTLTVMPQVAADVLGLDISKISCRNGDTLLPPAGPTTGSSSTMGVGSAVFEAARNLREKLAQRAGIPADRVSLADGRVGGRPLSEILGSDAELVGEGAFALAGKAEFDAEGGTTPYAMRTFGAVFVEVGVDPELGLLRLRRAVGSYSAGRIINPRTARAQMTGGMIWGWGMAAMEASIHDKPLGRWLSKNLAGVAIPTNADIPADLTVLFTDEFDGQANPLGAKGIGELGATGVAAAVANAVFNATGKRIRELPILPAQLIGTG